MENVMMNGFAELSEVEMYDINGGWSWSNFAKWVGIGAAEGVVATAAVLAFTAITTTATITIVTVLTTGASLTAAGAAATGAVNAISQALDND